MGPITLLYLNWSEDQITAEKFDFGITKSLPVNRQKGLLYRLGTDLYLENQIWDRMHKKYHAERFVSLAMSASYFHLVHAQWVLPPSQQTIPKFWHFFSSQRNPMFTYTGNVTHEKSWSKTLRFETRFGLCCSRRGGCEGYRGRWLPQTEVNRCCLR